MGQNFFTYLFIFFLGLGTGFFVFSPQALTTLVDEPVATVSPTSSVLSGTTQSVKVTRVIDGDTIEVEGGEKVRYIGINTPETVDPRKKVECFGKEASTKNKELVEGKMVRLEKDVSETDAFGRLLRYVYSDNIFVNEYLVKEGYAYADTYPPDVKYADHFTQLQNQAQQESKGLWTICPQ